MKQSNHHFSFTITVNTTKANVWQTLIDVQNWNQWDTELLEANLEGDFEVGAKGTMKPKTSPKLKFYISELITNQSYTINTIMPVGELVIKRSLIETNNEVHFTDDIAFTGFLKYIFGFMLGGQFRKVLPEVMNNFKRIAESK
ncbi:MAG: polyketide cyclase [Bacteroidetes bacterium]|nr:MAG: polyketide cyclase [Bacteroidota bacterium]